MLTKKTIPEVEKLIGKKIFYLPESYYRLHWTDYEDTNLVVNLLFNCKSILELGTYLGHTAENLANNTKCESLVTVDLTKEYMKGVPNFQANELLSQADSGKEIKNTKIKKVFDTTNQFFNKNIEKFDGIFIDASHEYNQVLIDSYNSISCLNPNGIIVWHDVYNKDNSCAKCAAEPENKGVILALRKLPFNVIKVGTSWIAFLQP